MTAETDHDAVASDTASAMSDGDEGQSLVALARRASGPAGGAADTALEALVERLYPLCERFLLHRLRSFRDAQDVAADAAQETMMRIATALDGCRATTDRELVAWVLVTARRTLIDMYGSPASGLAARSLAVELHEETDAAENLTEEEGHSGPRSTLLALALQAYDALTGETAELLWWRLVRGAEWWEVAKQLSTTPAGAKRRYQRAQGALRRAVAELASRLPAGPRAPVEALVATYRQSEVPDREPRGGPGAKEDAA